MKRIRRLSLLLILTLSTSLFSGQKSQHFYNVDKEIKVEGTIQEITMEPRYKNTSPFLVIVLEKKGNHQKYQVEVSPGWFFEYDFHKGENLTVLGSLYTAAENSQNIIAREIRFRGDTLVLRDKHGFPNWRGGKMKRKGKRKGINY